jgi:hypothetical protein
MALRARSREEARLGLEPRPEIATVERCGDTYDAQAGQRLFADGEETDDLIVLLARKSTSSKDTAGTP